jgi:CRP/FNR family transcriptional regulator, dissimilatory nitrate respiration regulator
MIAIMSVAIFERLAALAVRRRGIGKGASLFVRGDAVRALWLVDDGMMELIRRREDGGFLVLQRAGARSVLAEASLYADAYHCDAVALRASALLEVPRRDFDAALAGDAALANDWAAYLAREVQAARLRSEILSLKTVAERLDGWLAWNGGVLPAKGAWKGIAAETGVSPEALYRELGRRRLQK